jgi:hypothetical protein
MYRMHATRRDVAASLLLLGGAVVPPSTAQAQESSMNQTESAKQDAIHAAERIYRAWDEALGKKDLEGALALYAPDATLESPLVRHLLGVDAGIRKGQAELRSFIELVFTRTPPARQRYRSNFFTDGRKLMWEYPRAAPDGEQMDFTEVMDIEDGLIKRHCVYWGWYGVRILERDAYRR